MSTYILRTELSVEECIERFHDSIDHGLFSTRRHHPEWEFEGNVRGRKFWLRRRIFVQWGVPFRISMGERMLVGSFDEQNGETVVHAMFRRPFLFTMLPLFLLPHILAGSCLLLAGIASLLGKDVFTPPLNIQARLLVLAIGSLFTLVPYTMLVLQRAGARRIEQESNPKMIAFIQRTLYAELSQPSSIAGVADVR